MAMAAAALANQGRLLEPLLISKVTDASGLVLSEATPQVRRQVVSPRVARMMAEMLSSVTEGEGTGIEAAIPGFRVAGKTATAQKIDPATGRYNDINYVTSFVGFVPAERPRIVVSVVIDEPSAGANSGGSVAAPVFRRVAELTLQYLGVRPDGTRAVKLTDVAEYAKVDDPAKAAHAVFDAKRAEREPNEAKPEADLRGRESVKVPSVEGLPVRSAMQTVFEKGLVPVIEGTGRLVRTEPAIGTRVAKGSKLVLVFEPSM